MTETLATLTADEFERLLNSLRTAHAASPKWRMNYDEEQIYINEEAASLYFSLFYHRWFYVDATVQIHRSGDTLRLEWTPPDSVPVCRPSILALALTFFMLTLFGGLLLTRNPTLLLVHGGALAYVVYTSRSYHSARELFTRRIRESLATALQYAQSKT